MACGRWRLGVWSHFMVLSVEATARAARNCCSGLEPGSAHELEATPAVRSRFDEVRRIFEPSGGPNATWTPPLTLPSSAFRGV